MSRRRHGGVPDWATKYEQTSSRNKYEQTSSDQEQEEGGAMTILDEAVVTPEDVAETAEAVEAMIETPAAKSPVDRLKAIVGNMVPAVIDHTNCAHEATDNARRRCRRDKLAAATVASSEAYTIEANGEPYISALAVRAELLYQYSKGAIGDKAEMNQVLGRLGMEPTQFSRHDGRRYTIEITFNMAMPVTALNNGVRLNEAMRTRTIRRFSDYYGPQLKIAFPAGEPTIAERILVMYENDVETSRETQNVETYAITVSGEFSFGFHPWDGERLDIERMQKSVRDWLSNWMAGYVADVITPDMFTITKSNLGDLVDSEDYKLRQAYVTAAKL